MLQHVRDVGKLQWSQQEAATPRMFSDKDRRSRRIQDASRIGRRDDLIKNKRKTNASVASVVWTT
jgi:hypothetical protein